MFRRFILIGMTVSMLAICNPYISYGETKYSIKTMTPEVEQALLNRRDRHDQLNDLKAKGYVGENNRGYIDVFEDQEGAQSVADAENADRKIIYMTIARQNNLENSIETIERVFADVRREKASPGDKIQLENGEWVQK